MLYLVYLYLLSDQPIFLNEAKAKAEAKKED
jgi:hypothetical protein